MQNNVVTRQYAFLRSHLLSRMKSGPFNNLASRTCTIIIIFEQITYTHNIGFIMPVLAHVDASKQTCDRAKVKVSNDQKMSQTKPVMLFSSVNKLTNFDSLHKDLWYNK